jgi:hypothetical protein
LHDSDSHASWFPCLKGASCLEKGRYPAEQTARLLRQDPWFQTSPALWTIPILVRFRDGQGVKQLNLELSKREQRVGLPAVGTVVLAYPNGGGRGFYRTDLPVDELQALTRDLASLTLYERLALRTCCTTAGST